VAPSNRDKEDVMEDRRLESVSETAQRSARRLAGEAQDAAARASGYAQTRAQEVADRAGEYARDMGTQVERLTGRPIEAWSRDARNYVRSHPMQAVAITIGLGFLLGKLLARD
jgi:ElaB/YqjD/DUF883 family membrane-anchored ribosome-binding protein